MPAYVIANVMETWDDEALVRYRDGNTESVARHGGRFIARGGEQDVLEGEYAPVRLVIIEFPDMETARGWYASDDYAPLRELRRSASRTDILLVDGA